MKIRTLYYLFVFVLFSCSQGSGIEDLYSMSTGVVKSEMNVSKSVNYKWSVLGVYLITLSNGNTYLCSVGDNRNEIILINSSDTTDKLALSFPEEVYNLSARDSTLYVFRNNNRYVLKIAFSYTGNLTHTSDSLEMESEFNDSFFIAATYRSPIVTIGNDSLLIPYGVRSNTPNLRDSFAYLLTYKGKENILKYKRIVAYKDGYRYSYYPNLIPIAAYDESINTIYYTFPYSNTLCAYSLNTNSIDSIKIDGFEESHYDGSPRDFTYLRKFHKYNDANVGLYTNSNTSYLYLVWDNNHTNTNTSKVVCYDKDLNKLSSLESIDDFDNLIPIIKNEKLHMHVIKTADSFRYFDISID